MKTYSKYLFGALSIVAIALSAGSFIKAYATPASADGGSSKLSFR